MDTQLGGQPMEEGFGVSVNILYLRSDIACPTTYAQGLEITPTSDKSVRIK